MSILTVNQLVESIPGLTHGGVRWDIFNAEANGLAKSGAIIRRGRRILIDTDLYEEWLRDPERPHVKNKRKQQTSAA